MSGNGPAAAASSSVLDLDEGLIITKAASRRLNALMKSEPDLKLRIAVEGGGCSGFQYTYTLESAPVDPEDDLVFVKDNATVVVDEGSMEYVKGSTVDFVEEMIRSAFSIVNNPKAEAGCGCGTSFSLKEEDDESESDSDSDDDE